MIGARSRKEQPLILDLFSPADRGGVFMVKMHEKSMKKPKNFVAINAKNLKWG